MTGAVPVTFLRIPREKMAEIKPSMNPISELQSPELAAAWLTAIVDSADDAIISKTLDGLIATWNRGAERIFGYTADEVIGKPISILIPEDHADEEPIILGRLRKGERIEHYETIRQRKDGRLINVSLTVSPIRASDGRIIGASKIARDISDQRLAQKALTESATRLNLVLVAANVGDWSWDAVSDVVTLSDTAGTIFDIPPGPFMTWSRMRDLLHEDDRERARIAVEKALADHTDYDIEYRIRLSSGPERWISAKGRGQYDDDGKVLGMFGVVQDTSNARLVQEELREQTEALQMINEIGRVISAELDLHKIVQAVTDVATEITGARYGSFFYNVLNEEGASYMLYTLAGVPHEAFSHFPMPRATDLFGPTFRGDGVLRIGDVRRDPRYGKASPYFGMPAEQLRVVSYLAVPVVSRSGEVLGGLFFGHPDADVFNERDEKIVSGLAAQAAVAMDNARLYEASKRAQTEAEQAASENGRLYRQAEESSRLKEEFLATISHELRTPLNAILGWARMLRLGKLSKEEAEKAVETIERNARAQAQLIEDLLDVSRIITGKLRMDVGAADPNSLIEAAIESVTPAAQAKGVRIQKILDTGVVPLPGDQVRLQQVVWNLLSNGIKFTPRGGRVLVRLQRVNSHVEIIVSDTGQGIDPDFLPNVFDRFRQADQRSTRQHGGMGLGLAIVRHLVELHGGTVEATSPGVGEGASFTVRLPIAPVYQLDVGGKVHPAARNLMPPSDCIDRLDGLRILIVDDEPDTRELLSSALNYCGAQVTAAASAAEAFDHLLHDKPDVLISDIGMPDEDGYDFLRRVRSLPVEHGGRIPAIALTAYARATDRLQALKAGYQMHVSKPVELAELVAVAASLAQRRT